MVEIQTVLFQTIKKNFQVSISEKETSGVGTDLNSNPPITTPKKAATRQPEKKKKEKPVKPVTRQNTTTSGTSVSSNNSRRPPILQRLASAIRLRGPDSAVGSSIGQYDAGIYRKTKSNPVTSKLDKYGK